MGIRKKPRGKVDSHLSVTDELGDPTRDERDSCVLHRYVVVSRVEDVREVTEREEEGSVKELPGNREG